MQNLGQNIRRIVEAFKTAKTPLTGNDVLTLLPDISQNPRRERRIESVRTYLGRAEALGLLVSTKGPKGVKTYTLTTYYKRIMAQYDPEPFVPIAPKLGRVIPQSARPDISTVWRFPVVL